MKINDLFGSTSGGFIVGDVHLPKPPENDSEIFSMAFDVSKSLIVKLPTEQDIYWFVIEQYDKMLSYNSLVEQVTSNFPISLYEIEYEGRRSEKSYVGKPNQGIIYLETKVMPALEAHFGLQTSELIMAVIFGSYCDNFKSQIEVLRLKYAVHYHNNCISSSSFNFADKWNEVISSLRVEKF